MNQIKDVQIDKLMNSEIRLTRDNARDKYVQPWNLIKIRKRALSFFFFFFLIFIAIKYCYNEIYEIISFNNNPFGVELEVITCDPASTSTISLT